MRPGGRGGGGCGDDGGGNVIAQGGNARHNKRGGGRCEALSLLRRMMTMTMMGGIGRQGRRFMMRSRALNWLN